jgi:hypothetical protein
LDTSIPFSEFALNKKKLEIVKSFLENDFDPTSDSFNSSTFSPRRFSNSILENSDLKNLELNRNQTANQSINSITNPFIQQKIIDNETYHPHLFPDILLQEQYVIFKFFSF